MDYNLEFLYSLIPYELFALEPPDASVEESMIYELFLERTYKWIIEGEPAIYAAIKFWVTLSEKEIKACSIGIMPTPLVLSEFAEKIQNEELLKLINFGNYNTHFYQKLFSI
jgi:hypothetical protein